MFILALVMNELIEKLLEEVIKSPKDSVQRRKSMSRLLSALQPLLEQWIARRKGHPDKKVHPDLGSVLNESMAWAAAHIDEFDINESKWKKPIAVQQALLNWVIYKGRLDYRIRDLAPLLNPREIAIDAFEPGSPEAQAIEPPSLSQLERILEAVPMDQPQTQPETLSALDQMIQAWHQTEDYRRTSLKKALDYIRTDPDGKLKAEFSRNRPDCNCHQLFLRIAFDNPTDNVSELARQFKINPQTLHTLQRRCRKLVEQLVIAHVGFNPLLTEN